MHQPSLDPLKRVETALTALRVIVSSIRQTSQPTNIEDQDLLSLTPANGDDIVDEAATREPGHSSPGLAIVEAFAPGGSSANSITHALESISVSSSPDPLSSALLSLDELTRDIHVRPYSILHRLLRACWYNLLGYPDLVAGDAYKVLLLLDEAWDEAGEYHEEVLDDLKSWTRAYTPSGHQSKKEAKFDICLIVRTIHELECFELADEASDGTEEDREEASLETDLEWLKETCYVAAYRVLARALWICGCWKSAVEFLERGRRHFPDHRRLKMLEEHILKAIGEDLARKGQQCGPNDIKLNLHQLPDRGHVCREIYPWTISRSGQLNEPHQFRQNPDRLSESALIRINDQMKRVAPKLGVKVVELSVLHPDPAIIDAQTVKQLGVFAKEDIQPNEQILQEYTLYTANSRSYEAFCDACCTALPDPTSPTTIPATADSAINAISCPDCDVLFCSPRCLKLAQANYHPAICGRDLEDVCKDVRPAEAADAMYTLLLLRSLAMAETQHVHPLDLHLMPFICGDFNARPTSWHPFPSSPSTKTLTNGTSTPKNPRKDGFHNGAPRTLPFTFRSNILTPLHILQKMDVNIFTEEYKYDIWVFNTLYAKFRATASARMGRDGRPEVAAVHPLWCLANHSCDPNVEWEWGGSITFIAREKRVRWSARKGNGEEVILRQEMRGGIRKGEEVLNHYCDVELPVKERREWAVGALGGVCICERCVAEAACEDGG